MNLLERLADRRGLDRLWSLLPQARLVGGSVRDLLAGKPVNDLDLATPEPPGRVAEILEGAGIKVIPTGIAHGTVTAVIGGVPYEITTLRRDVRTDGRHATVAWTADWREDAARRDFTINALSLDRHDVLHDYFGGAADLAARRVRFVGDAGKRVEEDALRALRFFRFDARFGGGAPDAEAITAITARLGLIDRLSAERIAAELLKILTGPRVIETLRAMAACGLLARLVPEPDIGALARLVACGGPDDPILRLFALCPAKAEEAGARLKLSNAAQARLAAFGKDEPALSPDLSDDDLRRALAEQDLPLLLDRTWLAQARAVAAPDAAWDRLRARLEAMPKPVFPLTGADALACGIAPGPAVGRWLRRAETWWKAQGCMPDRAACLAFSSTAEM